MIKSKLQSMLDDRIGQQNAHKLDEYEWIIGLMEDVCNEYDKEIFILTERLNESTNFNNKLHIKIRNQTTKIKELLRCLKETAIVCKEKNSLKGNDAAYWLGAENSYLQVANTIIKEFKINNKF